MPINPFFASFFAFAFGVFWIEITRKKRQQSRLLSIAIIVLALVLSIFAGGSLSPSPEKSGEYLSFLWIAYAAFNLVFRRTRIRSKTSSTENQQKATKRPMSLTAVTLVLVVLHVTTAVIGLTKIDNLHVSSVFDQQNQLVVPIAYAIILLDLSLSIICGFAILAGRNWARILFLIWSGSGIVVYDLFSPSVLGIVIHLLFIGGLAFIFFQPAANKYFK
jgi:hypothetical protein